MASSVSTLTALADELESETGTRPPFDIGSLDDLDESVRASVDLLRHNPLLLHRDGVRGFVYDVATGTAPGDQLTGATGSSSTRGISRSVLV